MSQRKVSVVITCYNYGRYLQLAVDSALQQTYRNLEIIVVNDGSTDDTDYVMERYASDPRVIYLRQENSGQAVAKNAGIAKAAGEFVAFLDADDAWEANKLELQMALFTSAEIGVVYSRASYMNDLGERVPGPRMSDIAEPKAGRITQTLFVDNVVPFSSAVVRRECFDRCGAMNADYRMAIDWDLWLRLSVVYLFAYVDAPLLKYRVGHSGQMSKNLHVRERDTRLIMQNFLKANPRLIPKKLVRWVMAYSYCLWGYRSRRTDGWKSLKCYAMALRWRPNHLKAYKGLMMLALVKSLAPFRVDR